MGFFDSSFHRRVLRKWRGATQAVRDMDTSALQGQRRKARELRRLLNTFIYASETRLTHQTRNGDAIPKPLNTDWAYRPEIWRGPIQPTGLVKAQNKSEFGSELKIFHDCPLAELTLQQLRNLGDDDLAPFGLKVEVYSFRGSFLSLVVDLPQDAVAGLERRHLIGLTVSLDVEQPLEIFVRLNIQHGPNVEQIVREIYATNEERTVDFDLAYSKINEKRIEKMWLDLIFEGAEMNQIVLRDLTLTRRPRAEV